jgi:putative oxidoreductase
MTITESRARAGLAATRTRSDRVQRLLDPVRRHSGTLLRIALGVVYIWFGALKVAGTTPVGALVEATTPWADPGWFVPAMGAVEVALGLWLIVGRGLLLALPVFVAHLIGTFGVLVMVPQVAFQDGNPLRLTMEGEFVAKNLVLLVAVILVTTRTRRVTAGG